jgi:hypothetical protein
MSWIETSMYSTFFKGKTSKGQDWWLAPSLYAAEDRFFHHFKLL